MPSSQRAASNWANSSSSLLAMILGRLLPPRIPPHGIFPSILSFPRSLVSNLGFTLSLLVPSLIRILFTSHVLYSNMNPLVLKLLLVLSMVSAPISFLTSNMPPMARPPHSLAKALVPMRPCFRRMLSKDLGALIAKGLSTRFPFISVDQLSAFLLIRRVQFS